MTVQKVQTICELAMCDPEFREAFIKDPYEAVAKWNLGILPEEITTLLCIRHDDAQELGDVSARFIETKACLPTAGLGCDTKKIHPAGPR